jgi:hypothetical protein
VSGPNNIRRGIRPERRPAAANVAKIGQVTRLRQRDDLNRGLNPEGVRAAFKSPKVLAVSVVLAGAATLIAIGGGFALWSRTRVKAAPVVESAFSEKSMRVTSKFLAPSGEEATELVSRAVATRDPRVIAEVFRDGEARSQDILSFLDGLMPTEGPVERYEWQGSVDVNGLLVEGVRVTFRGIGKPTDRIALLTPDSAGKWKMDFDAFARTTTPSWEALMEGGVDEARVRVVAGKDYYFNGPFIDESQWHCYRLETPDVEKAFFGYCRVGTPAAEAMQKLFSEDEPISRVTLDIRKVAGTRAGQFEIHRVVAKDWILPGEG